MRDEWFVRGDIPMTKSEVRAAAISKLELEPGSVLYDIGAGTGSVSIEAAKMAPDSMIVAIERKTEAISLIRRNQEKFQTENVIVVEGEAPGALEHLPMPTHAFIGGSAGRLEAILDVLTEKNPDIRIVMSAIALETLSEILGWIGSRGREAEIVQIFVSRAKTAGKYHMMMGQNPVYLVSFGGNDDV